MMSFSALAAEMRLEAAGDEPGIRKVHEAAFGRPDEGRLVDALREGGSLWLSMVMVHEEQIVAHVAWSPVMLEEARKRPERWFHRTRASGWDRLGYIRFASAWGLACC